MALRLFEAMFRSRDKPKNALGGGYYFPWGSTASGKNVNERTAMCICQAKNQPANAK